MISDLRFNRWLHQSGTGEIYYDESGNLGISVETSASVKLKQN